MSRAGQFVLVLLTAVGGVACHSQSDLLKRLDGGAAGMTGASGTGGGGGSAPDGSADGTPDGSPDAGPDPLPGYHWVALPAPQGAPMKTIAVDSQGALYASARTSLSGLTMPSGGTGIFTSRDEGASWRTANLGIVDYNVVGLAAVGTTLYAGTSSLLRSTDGGASWQEAAPFDYPEGYQYISGGGDLVAAWSGGHIWVSTDAGSTFRMTTLKQGGALSVDVVENGSAILVGTTFGVFRSTDAGATFNPVQGIFNGQGLYARLRCDGQRTCYGTGHDTPQFSDPDALLRSTDAGATWTPLSINNSYMVLAVSDTGSVYIGVGGYKMWRSDDAGVTLTEIVRPTAAGWVEPNCDGPLAARGDQVFAACADGVYRSDDKGQTWRRASGSPATGPITGAAAGIFVDASTTALGPGGDIYVNGVAGLAPDGTDNYALERSSDGGWTWQTAAPTFFSDPCTVTPGGALECLNVATPSMRVPLGRSDDHGATWTEVPLPASLSPYNGFGLATDGSIVYLAASGVARSSDDGRTFQVIPDGPVAVSLQVLRNGHLLAGGGSAGGGYRSTDQGATWQPLAFLSALPVVEESTGRLIRSVSGSKFEASTDEGLTWTSLASSGVPDLGIAGPVPLATDGAGHLFTFGPDASSNPTRVGPLQVSASADGDAHFLPMHAQIPNPGATAFATDKQGRLLVATLGGVFRLESDADPGPPRPDAGTSDVHDGGSGTAPRPLAAVMENGPWSAPLWGLGVDAAHRVYGADESTVYVIDAAGAISPYLTLAEAASAAGLGTVEQFFDIDVGPDGQLYALVSSGSVVDTTRTDTVVMSSAAHQATRLRDLVPLTETQIAVIGAGRVGYFTSTEFWSATAAGTQNVYTAAALGWDTTVCPMRDVVISSSGAVAFLPYCSDHPIQIGTVAGAPLGTLYQPSADMIYGEHFGCGAKDPAGGFYFMVTDIWSGRNPRLVHLPEVATGTTAPTLVPTEPPLGEVSVERGGGLFNDCIMAAAPDGAIYLYTTNGIWKVGAP